LISNTDDHLRNHGFLYTNSGRGWRLAPAYDLNPVPVDVKPRILTTSITHDDGTASLDLAFSVAENFGIKKKQAIDIAHAVGGAVAKWQMEAKDLGLSRNEIDRMASAFEHRDAESAKRR
jgi:serine/threonine-protein kinase HipA